MFQLHLITHVGFSPSRSLKLFGRVIIFEVFHNSNLCDHGTWTLQSHRSFRPFKVIQGHWLW